jgi:hypothetical protein
MPNAVFLTQEAATEPDFAAAHPQNGTFGLDTVYFL